MDELTAAIRARELVQRVNTNSIPVQVEPFLAVLRCELKVDNEMGPHEAGYCLSKSGKHVIVVNGKDSPERQRFTTFHEMGHIDLKLPSEHAGSPSWSYNNRSANEICCDTYAAEILLPHRFFKPLVDSADIGMAALDDLAEKFEASVTATGSRFASTTNAPCAFVVSENGMVRYTVISKALREVRAWITRGMAVPSGSSTALISNGQSVKDPQEIAADVWFNDWRRGGVLLEEARYLRNYDQTLTLLWFEDEEVPHKPSTDNNGEDGEMGLKELDGILPWPGKRRRR
ncbi:ImmA/IrrE family metallo-endopeptidase [Candidatus Poribacteria bacterium]|nr:ImmA/IrrE family metallo-endopeptidase [Candidatus Poribacteria bacterium]